MKRCGHGVEVVFEQPFTRERWRLCHECPTDQMVGYLRFFEAAA